jgi:hypothetical protein
MSFNITVEGGKSVRLKTKGKYCDRDIVVTATGGVADPIIKPLEITGNGTYTAPDGVDGYSPVTVNVPTGGGSENFDKLIERTLTEVSSAVTSIGNGTFYKCNKLVSVDFPNVISIGADAFYNCYNLPSVDFPKAEIIGADAFNKCHKLESVDFPKAIGISSNAFSSTYSLKTIILRKSVICSLASTNAFSGCYHLHGTKNSAYNPNGDKDCYIYVPRDLVDSYKSAPNWSKFASQIRAIEDYPEICGG